MRLVWASFFIQVTIFVRKETKQGLALDALL